MALTLEFLRYVGPLSNHSTDRFNTGVGDMEKTIVTSTGPFVVAFNFRSVKAGKLREYKIKRYDDVVVADNFRFGDDREIVSVAEYGGIDGAGSRLPRHPRRVFMVIDAYSLRSVSPRQVVTMPNDLRMEAKSQLLTPSRRSLAPSSPRPSAIRKSNIVQQWDD